MAARRLIGWTRSRPLLLLAALFAAAAAVYFFPAVFGRRYGPSGPSGFTVVALYVLSFHAGVAAIAALVAAWRGRGLFWAVGCVVAYAAAPVVGVVLLFEAVAQAPQQPGETRTYESDVFDGRTTATVRRTVTLNAQGWRSDADFEDARDTRKVLLLVGDSFVYGLVDQPDTIAALAMKRHLPADVVVHSIGRTGFEPTDYLRETRRYLAMRKERGLPSPSWIVVSVFLGNDFFDPGEPPGGAARLRAKLGELKLIAMLSKMWSLRTDVNDLPPRTRAMLAERGVRPERFNHNYLSWAFGSGSGERRRYEQALTELIERFAADDETARRKGAPAPRNPLSALRAIAAEAGSARFGLLFLPVYFQISPVYADFERPMGLQIAGLVGDAPQRAMRAWTDAGGICLIDVLPALREYEERTGRRTAYSLDSHFNAEGNEVVARELARVATADACGR